MSISISDAFAEQMIDSVREMSINRLLTRTDNEWFSGFLNDDDIIDIESKTGRKILCSVESGEYFYKFEK